MRGIGGARRRRRSLEMSSGEPPSAAARIANSRERGKSAPPCWLQHDFGAALDPTRCRLESVRHPGASRAPAHVT